MINCKVLDQEKIFKSCIKIIILNKHKEDWIKSCVCLIILLEFMNFSQNNQVILLITNKLHFSDVVWCLKHLVQNF